MRARLLWGHVERSRPRREGHGARGLNAAPPGCLHFADGHAPAYRRQEKKLDLGGVAILVASGVIIFLPTAMVRMHRAMAADAAARGCTECGRLAVDVDDAGVFHCRHGGARGKLQTRRERRRA